ncbi:uncharacterized protein LOC132176176 [Corylus avellana]|uniref:uncharacterized protein LOC132176176 n=1 Tax=Corylus avellana TaxID=13451 RepID=UPI00286A256C|nr:uncharacterized protein LOC132176176 [Corylus avellana]
MDRSLRDAAQEGSIDALHSLVRGDPYILDTIDKIPFVETPLHIAASAGHTQFAMEIVRLKPSLAWKLNQDSFSPMHLALQNNQTHVVCRLLDADKDLVRVQGKEGATPLHHVAQTGNLYLLAEFRKVCPMSIKDVTIRGETALHFALNNTKLDAFEFLIRWLQQITLEDASSLWENKLLNWKNEEGNTLLHMAVSNDQPQVVRWLLNARIDTNATNLAGFTALDILEEQTQIDNNEIRDMLASSLPRNMENVADLRDAAKQGSIDALYELIQMDAKVLDRIDNIPFVETPLHIAASAGNIQFVREIMSLKPSFVRKLNQNGFTPMHLALQNNQTQVVLQLLSVDNDLVHVEGKEGVTPLHYVAQIGNFELLKQFLKACPKSIEHVTIRKETVMHVALKYNMFEAFRSLLSWLRENWYEIDSLWDKKLLGWQDDEGNTVLHIAISKSQTEIVRSLLDRPLFYSAVGINAKNSEGLSALNILHGETEFDHKIKMRNMLRRARGLRASLIRYCFLIFHTHVVSSLRLKKAIGSTESRNMVLGVLAVIIAGTFQTTLSPPGGLWQEDYDATASSGNSPTPFPAPPLHEAGTVIMSKHQFLASLFLNSICFLGSIIISLLLLPPRCSFLFTPLLVYFIYSYVASIIIINPW